MSEQPCADCVRLKIDRPGQRTRFCPADGGYRCREHRSAHLAKLGVGKPVVPHPPAGWQQRSYL